MEVSYLCVARQGDVLEMVWGDVMDAILFIEQNKTVTKQIKERSPRLRSAFQLARNTMDEKVTCRAINKGWDKAKNPLNEK